MALGKGLESLIPDSDAQGAHPSDDILASQNEIHEPVHRFYDEPAISPATGALGTPQVVSRADVVSKKESEKDKIFWIEINKIEPNPYQPRREFEESALQSLADSIKNYGILQPLLVYKVETDTSRGISVAYQLIAGERRWRAAKLLGLREVPVIIRRDEATNRLKLELALIENVQREDLNSIDRAHAFKQLIDEFRLSQKEVGERIGKSREFVTNTLRLLNLPDHIQETIRSGVISEGHAKAILIVGQDAELQKKLLDEVVTARLNVRETEFAARALVGHRKVPQRRDVALLQSEEKVWQRQLEDFLGTRVSLQKQGEKGKIVVEFYSPEELRGILDKIIKRE
ncbi:MAG: ParB/RepB/Spo0J family partition protein [bacterium]|nr:ParB/RepB/Spo0J family partition protein [bacterium]